MHAVLTAVLILLAAGAQAEPDFTAGMKAQNAFLRADLVERAGQNAAAYPWAKAMQERIVARAEPWLNLSDDELWDLMFGPNIDRSWMVWSNGFCPSCKADVRMYNWKVDPFKHPWKMQCPHCEELFPKNDFEAFHRSGFDKHGVFQPDLADRSLLFNADHPDSNDPLHTFGVDDGEGYFEGENTWRFIGCYLIYGQWKKAAQLGAVRLSEAYAVTGDTAYAHKALVLLDRIADLYPDFDFGEQGYVYENPDITRGQISTWHDACEEVRELAMAYDRVYEAGRAHSEPLAAFLSAKAAAHHLENKKATWEDIQRNIEVGILIDTLNHRSRIESNRPRTDVALLVIKTVLGWPANRDHIMELLDGIIEADTQVDGVSGEKGMAGYATIAPRALADILGLFSLLDPAFLGDVYARHPVLHQTWRFHMDMRCLDAFYPQSGDSGMFGVKDTAFKGVTFTSDPGLQASMYTFMWDMYQLTGDEAYAQELYRANGSATTNLPHDLFAEDPAQFQADVADIIAVAGTEIAITSVNKEQWRLAILRSGEGDNRRALWIDYDASGKHRHQDGMNLGLFAKGLNLVPEYGYPAVGYGGWDSMLGKWYARSAAHVTVVLDGQDHHRKDGETTLWADGESVRAIRVAGADMIEGDRFERTAALVDLDEADSYVVDVFRVRGGADHTQFFGAFLGTMETDGLTLSSAEDYGYDTPMRNFQRDASPASGWAAEWTIEDRFEYLAPGEEVKVRRTDFTTDAAALTSEAWIDLTQYGEGEPEWIPRLMVRRQSDTAPVESTFVSVIEPYDGVRKVESIKRIPLRDADGSVMPDTFVGLEVSRTDGLRDLMLVGDPEHPGDATMTARAANVTTNAQFAVVTLGPDGPVRIALAKGDAVNVNGFVMNLHNAVDFIEVAFTDGRARVVAGDAKALVGK
jgi:hypothetical protein